MMSVLYDLSFSILQATLIELRRRQGFPAYGSDQRAYGYFFKTLQESYRGLPLDDEKISLMI